MSPDEIRQEIERQIAAGIGFDESDDFERNAFHTEPPPQSRPRKANRQRSGKKSTTDPRVQAAHAEEARKRTISVIYKQLAKVLHPDLENDPARREQKHHLMQELTTAYKAGDLHTLLRLELSWIHHEEEDLNRLTEEKLKVYIEFLQKQVADLQQEIAHIPYLPQLAAVSRLTNPFTYEPDHVDSILASLRPYTESLEDAKTALHGPGARARRCAK